MDGEEGWGQEECSAGVTSSFLHLCTFMGFSSSSSRARHLVLSFKNSLCMWKSSCLGKTSFVWQRISLEYAIFAAGRWLSTWNTCPEFIRTRVQISRTYVKANQVYWPTHNPTTGETEGGDAQISWLVRQAGSVDSRFSQRPISQSGKPLRNAQDTNLYSPCAHSHVCPDSYMYITHIHMGGKKLMIWSL